MHHLKFKRLESHVPLGDPGIGILTAERVDCPLDGQELLLHRTEPSVSTNRVLLIYTTGWCPPPPYLQGQNGPPVRGVSLQNKREGEGVPLQRAFLTCTNASWDCSVHWTRSGAPFRVRSVKGLLRSASAKYRLTSFLAMGGGQDMMAAVVSICESTRYPR